MPALFISDVFLANLRILSDLPQLDQRDATPKTQALLAYGVALRY